MYIRSKKNCFDNPTLILQKSKRLEKKVGTNLSLFFSGVEALLCHEDYITLKRLKNETNLGLKPTLKIGKCQLDQYSGSTDCGVSSEMEQSYEIKLPPRAILGFKVLDIFSVEN